VIGSVVSIRSRLRLALTSLLPLVRQRNRHPRYNFAELGIEDLDYLFITPWFSDCGSVRQFNSSSRFRI
jgi:hypothetical protein